MTTSGDHGTTRRTIDAAGTRFSAIDWGDPGGRPLLMLHGVTASAAVWWRVGPALAAGGRHVVAVDLPGHGLTGGWTGRHRFADTAADIARFARAANLVSHLGAVDLQVVGHSWGAMVSAALPAAGLRPSTIVLLDPPSLPHSVIAQMASDPTWRTFDDPDEARAAVAAANPTWEPGDVAAAAEAVCQVDVAAARSVVLDNGDWDAGLAALADPAAVGVPVWVIRGEPASGSLTLDPAAAEFERRYGRDHVITIPGGPHSPQRTHLEATLAALERALAD